MIETAMLAVALEDTVIDPVIEEEIAPRRNARRALIRGELISILIPCPLRRYEVELGQFPKSRTTIKICNGNYVENYYTPLYSLYTREKNNVLLPVDIFVLWMNAGNGLQYDSEDTSMSIHPSSARQKNIGRNVGIICGWRI